VVGTRSTWLVEKVFDPPIGRSSGLVTNLFAVISILGADRYGPMPKPLLGGQQSFGPALTYPMCRKFDLGEIQHIHFSVPYLW
jgi:hypothetical protein